MLSVKFSTRRARVENMLDAVTRLIADAQRDAVLYGEAITRLTSQGLQRVNPAHVSHPLSHVPHLVGSPASGGDDGVAVGIERLPP